MPQSVTTRWVLLIHQIPPNPDDFRVKVGRRLQRLGAAAIKNSVYVLPRSDETVEDFQWQMREIVAGGGEASVCEANFVDGLTDTQIEALFRAARDADYGEIVADAQRLRKAVPSGGRRGRTDGRGQIAADVNRLKRRLAEIVAIDFFGAPRRRAAQEEVAQLEARLRPSDTQVPAPAHSAEAPRGATWVTREGVYIDRIASAWLIRRFIDSKAQFKFVPAEGYRPRPGELRFDMFEAEYTHEGDACTFETLVARFGLGDRALRVIAEIVHDIDCKEAKFGRPIALAGHMQQDLVEQRGWISAQEYKEGLAFAQLAPGPLAAQLAIYLGWVRGQVLGATVVGIAFVAPSFLMVLVLSELYVRFGGLPWMQGLFYGIGAAVIAIIARSVLKLVRMTLGRDQLLWILFAVSAVVTAWTESEIIWVFLACGFVPMLLRGRQRAPATRSLAVLPVVPGLAP